MLTVSIVLHRTPEYLLRSVLESLAAEPSVSLIYLVDNSPDDRLRSFAAAAGPRVDYTRIPNRGFGQAHNTAIRRALDAGTDWHLVLNPDVRWTTPVLDRLIDFMRSEPGCAMVQPVIRYPDGRLQHTCRMLPTPFDLFARRFLPSFLTRRRMRRYLIPAERYSTVFDCPYLQGSFMLIAAPALRSAGLFDERFFMYPEDIDLTRRIHRSYRTLHCPFAEVTHDHAAASSRPGRMMWIHITNMIRYFNKYGWLFDAERRRMNKTLLQ